MFEKASNPHHILTTDAEDKFVAAVMQRIRTTNYSQAIRFIIGEVQSTSGIDEPIDIASVPARKPARRQRQRKAKPEMRTLGAIPGIRKGMAAAQPAQEVIES